MFVVSKVWCTYQSSPERVEEGVDKTLKNLGLDYVDLVLVVSFLVPSPPFFFFFCFDCFGWWWW